MIGFRERVVESSHSILFLPTDMMTIPEPHLFTAGRPKTIVHISPAALECDGRIAHEKEDIPIEQTHGIILAGGIALRMKSTDPKQLLPISAEAKLIDFPMRMLARAGIKDITLSCVQYTVDRIVQHFGSNSESDPTYQRSRFFVKEEPEGVIPALRDPIEEYHLRDRPLVIAHGDEVLFADVRKIYQSHRDNNHPITVCMTDDPMSKNKVFLRTDENDRIVQVGRYPDDVTLSQASRYGYNYTLTGLWIVDEAYIDFLKNSEGADPFIFRACQQGILYGYRNAGLFFNCNTPEDIEIARRAFIHIPR